MKAPKILCGIFDKNISKNDDLNGPYTESNQPANYVQISSFRRYLPQILASSVKNLLIVDFGLSMAYSTILIPALTGLNSAHNSNETLSLTPEQATWLASITVICQPFGGIASGFLTEPIGRKLALICVNIPYMCGWILLYYANSMGMIYTAFVLHGLSMGLMEAPIMTYIGEISEPHIRGILTATITIAAAFGMAVTYFLGSAMSWRTAAIVCASVPALSIILTAFIPETPIWLLSRNRQAEALKSLQWLRGWVNSSESVQAEFDELQRSKINAQTCYNCEKRHEICHHPLPTVGDKIRDLFRRRTLRPFILIASLYVISVFAGITPFRPYIVQILCYYQSPVDANNAVAYMGYFGFGANVLLVCTISSFGKRNVYLYSMAIVVAVLFVLGIYGFAYLPLDQISFDMNTNSTNIQSSSSSMKQYVPVVGFGVLQFVSNFGITSMPNMMISEVFPFKSRALATGLVTIFNYCTIFLVTKLFYGLEVLLTLPGLAILFGLIGLFGFVGMYFTLPETEGRSLEDIENYFSNRKRKFADIHIPCNSHH